jgi:hypothetical protein
VVLCATRRQAEEARELVTAILDGVGLRLHPAKTRIADRARGAEGFDCVLAWFYEVSDNLPCGQVYGCRRFALEFGGQRFGSNSRPEAAC